MVGVNSDASVRRLAKGTDRPVATEAARARVLAGLAAVDCVVLFDEDTPLAAHPSAPARCAGEGRRLQPRPIVGADWVEARGGRVVQVPLVAGYSTSALVERSRATS